MGTYTIYTRVARSSSSSSVSAGKRLYDDDGAVYYYLSTHLTQPCFPPRERFFSFCFHELFEQQQQRTYYIIYATMRVSGVLHAMLSEQSVQCAVYIVHLYTWDAAVADNLSSFFVFLYPPPRRHLLQKKNKNKNPSHLPSAIASAVPTTPPRAFRHTRPISYYYIGTYIPLQHKI